MGQVLSVHLCFTIPRGVALFTVDYKLAKCAHSHTAGLGQSSDFLLVWPELEELKPHIPLMFACAFNSMHMHMHTHACLHEWSGSDVLYKNKPSDPLHNPSSMSRPSSECLATGRNSEGSFFHTDQPMAARNANHHFLWFSVLRVGKEDQTAEVLRHQRSSEHRTCWVKRGNYGSAGLACWQSFYL